MPTTKRSSRPRFLFTIAATLALLLSAAAPLHADVLRIVIDGTIHPIADEYLGRALDEAEKNNDAAVLIVLRTPGGLLDSTREMVNKLFAARVPVIIWVAPAGSRAASAGFFLLEAADVAAMAPGTNTGAAHPVAIGGVELDEIMKSKIENDAAAFMRTIASKRGRNVEVAESAVRESKSFTEQEALDQKLIDIVAADEAALFRAIDATPVRRFDGTEVRLRLSGLPVRPFEMTLRQKVLSFLMDPNIAFILISLGMLGLWAEFNHPGAIVPGLVGFLAIVLAVFALDLLPTRFAALGLILAAFVLFVLEAKFATHGILGAGGVLAMFLGGVLLVDGPIPEMRVSWITALAVSVPFGIIAVFLMSLALKAFRGKVVTGEEGMIGEVGVARTALAPTGKIFVHGEIWNAVSATAVETGARVRVRSIEGLLLHVEPVETGSGGNP